MWTKPNAWFFRRSHHGRGWHGREAAAVPEALGSKKSSAAYTETGKEYGRFIYCMNYCNNDIDCWPSWTPYTTYCGGQCVYRWIACTTYRGRQWPSMDTLPDLLWWTIMSTAVRIDCQYPQSIVVTIDYALLTSFQFYYRRQYLSIYPFHSLLQPTMDIDRFPPSSTVEAIYCG